MKDFYEDDEPAGDVVAAFEAGEKVLTSPFGIPVVTAARTRLEANRIAPRPVEHAS